jgi:hypothetical protein
MMGSIPRAVCDAYFNFDAEWNVSSAMIHTLAICACIRNSE